MELTTAERRAVDAIDHEGLIATLVDLVRIPSVTGTDAESDIQHDLAERLRRLDLDVDAWKIDLGEAMGDPGFPGTEVDRSEAYGLVATAGEGDPALVMQGHVDVVPIGDPAKWGGADPFAARIVDGVLHGRGACDMKGGLAAILAATKALQASGLRFERALAVHCVVSEEDGGLGAFATLRRGHGGEAAIIPEATSNRIVTATAGALTFRLEVPGRAAHGSARLEGVSAVEAYWPLHLAMRELEARRNQDIDPLFAGNPLPYGISVGHVHAGDWASSVPDLLVAEGRYGVRLGEDPADARRDFEEAIAQACARDPWLSENRPRLTWPGGQFAPGRTPDGHGFIEETSAAIETVTGQRLERAAGPYGSDLRLYAGVGGIPTLHFGPGDVRMAHAPREQVPLDEVARTAQVLTVLAVRRLEGHV
ncbi:ArgE/DapE family deacylase [Mariniluteicoccus flavus]